MNSLKKKSQYAKRTQTKKNHVHTNRACVFPLYDSVRKLN